MVGRVEVVVELDHRTAIEQAVDAWGDGDVLVVAGKGHEIEQWIAGEAHPFGDRQVAREALAARRCR